MSHGSVEKCEPNLIPMLDLVLQLVMFFMVCANFIAEDLNESVKLPTALQARPLDKSEDYVIFLNVDKEGHVLLGKGKKEELEKRNLVLTNATQVKNYMVRSMEADVARKEAAKKRGAKEEPKISLVVLRAHEKCSYKQVNDVLQAARAAGYIDVQLRAQVGNSKQ